MQNTSFISKLFHGVLKRIKGVFISENKRAGLTWVREKYLKHAPEGKIRSYKYRGHKIYYNNPPEFLKTLQEIFINEIYKMDIPVGSIIIDCGANIGLSTIYFKQICPTAEIIAFEPDKTNYELFVKNIDSFKLEKVTAKKEAVWIQNTELTFSQDGNMGSKIDLEKSNSKITMVKAVRLSDLLDKKIFFLKMDIEGAEYAVLKDISTKLNNVQTLFVEYHGKFSQSNELTEIFNIIQKAGFNYYIRQAADNHVYPLMAGGMMSDIPYDVQLNIFCFKNHA